MANLLKKHSIELLFLLSLIYILIISIFNLKLALSSLKYAVLNFLKVVPFLILAQIIIFLFDKYSRGIRELVLKGKKNWLLFSIAGVLSIGPVYMWYDVLSELKNKGLGLEFVALFLYNRAIKIFLIPLQIVLLGWELTLLINAMIFAFSYVYAYIIKLSFKS